MSQFTNARRKKAREKECSKHDVARRQEGEAMTQCEEEARECKRMANKSNRSTSGRVDSLAQEANKGAERAWQTQCCQLI